jgi:enoyl-CoA hydratase
MLHVTLEHVRRARQMTLAADLRMERGMVRHCFHLRPGPRERDLRGRPCAGGRQGPCAALEPAHDRGRHAGHGGGLLRSPWPDHAHPLRGLA